MFGFGRRPTPAASSRAADLGATIAATRNLAIGGRAVRRFDAAVVDRLTASWMSSDQAIDFELRRDLDRLRSRSRDLFKNNEYAARFARMVRNNVVGPDGFTLQVRVKDPNGKPDALANSAIEEAFSRWCRPNNCDVTGRRGFVDIIRGVATTTARDGEYLVRGVRGSNRGEFGYQLQTIDVARIDTKFNREATPGNNAVVMGVEFDDARAPVAIHLFTSASPSGQLTRKRERVPMAELFHGFIPLEDEQSRGVPWLHAAMRRMNDLNGYREAAVIAARVGACKMGIWETPDGGPPPGASEEGEARAVITEAEPAHFDYAPPGYKLASFDPAYPHEQFDAFCKAALRGIASGIGVSYHGLANDLQGVNFSSIRAGVLDEREEWMAIQNWLITSLLTPLYEQWIESALLLGAIKLPNGSALPAAKLDKFRAHNWQGRRWSWVDPLKDIQASAMAIAHRLASPQQVAAQAGRDPEDILDDIAAWEALAKTKGVSLPSAVDKPSPAKKTSPNPSEDDAEDDE